MDVCARQCNEKARLSLLACRVVVVLLVDALLPGQAAAADAHNDVHQDLFVVEQSQAR